MKQDQINNTNLNIYQNKHQSIQINRLMKFIQNKKTTSFSKLKQMFSAKQAKQNPFSDRHSIKNTQKNQNQSVSLNTKNIFVARNKTQASSPRIIQCNSDRNTYKIFITKQQILKLHDKEKLQFISSNLNPEHKLRSNLFPPVSLPKIKKPVYFHKYQDQTTSWLNSDLISGKQLKLIEIKQQNSNPEQESHRKHQQIIQSLSLQREKYNKSLQKLIQKAFKSKRKQKTLNNAQDKSQINNNQNDNLEEGYKNRGQSIYASKDKLNSNPNLKIKKDARFKSERKEINNKYLASPRSLNPFQLEYKRKIIHANKDSMQYGNPSMKLKTQVTGKSSEYQPTSIRKQNKTLKLISQLQQSIIRSQIARQPNNQQIQRQKTLVEVRKLQTLLDSNQYLSKLISSNLNNGQNFGRQQRIKSQRPKVKTLQSEEFSSAKKKSTLNWELAGYDWSQTVQQVEQNAELEQYVKKMIKSSNPINLDEKMNVQSRKE